MRVYMLKSAGVNPKATTMYNIDIHIFQLDIQLAGPGFNSMKRF